MTSTKDERAPRDPSKKPCRFFHLNDCFRGDRCHMVHAPKDSLAPCQVHLFWMEDPWSRPACEWGELCTYPHPREEGPEDAELLRTNVALQTENSQLARVREYAAEVLGKGGAATDTGVARSGTSRYNQKLALLEARDPEEFSRRCVSDPSLCRSLLRVYLLGGGVCRSLEEAGKAASDAVAAGKYPVKPSPVGDGESGAAAAAAAGDVPAPGGATASPPPPPPPPLRVRVQALPKVMEMQLIDEDSTFWDDNFPNLVRERQSGAFTHVLSVVFSRGAFLWGLAEAETHGRSIIENNNEDSAVCRAFYKIKEVTSRAELSYGEDWTAIDIGAAPGGWTSFLASKCRRVLSVDPAELDPSVLALPNVVHVRQLVQNATGVLLDLLAEVPPRTATASTSHEEQNGGESGGGSGGGGGRAGAGASSPNDGITRRRGNDAADSPSPASSAGGTVWCAAGAKPGLAARSEESRGAQLVVSDMNAEPSVVASVLLSAMAAGLARPGAVVVATFKDFCGRHKRMRDEVASALARLKAGTAASEGDGDGDGYGDGGGDGGGGVVRAAGHDGDVVAVADRGYNGGGAGIEATTTAVAGAGGRWRLEGIKTMKLLAGGRAEVTIVARVAYEV
ncbi:unnamed protein product [Pylaiella littoralis]